MKTEKNSRTLIWHDVFSYSMRKRLWFYIRAFFYEHFFLLLAIGIFSLIVFLISWKFGVTDKIRIGIYSKGFLKLTFLYTLLFFVFHALYIMAFIRPKRLTKYIFSYLKANYISYKRIVNGILGLISFQIAASSFTSLKAMIPVINPYSWDPFFINIDSIIHLGYHPWILLHPIFGKPLITFLVNYAYNLWFFILYFILYYQLFSLKDQRLRMHYLLATVSTWFIVGGAFAVFFSSVGPCFYGKLTGDFGTFQPLMDYLDSANETYPIYALNTQNYLWDKFIANEMGLGVGISAMPSLHVAQAVLMALLAWKQNLFFRFFFIPYAFIVMIGSVHLAWHYAVDGYFSIILTPVIWYATGLLTNHINFKE